MRMSSPALTSESKGQGVKDGLAGSAAEGREQRNGGQTDALR